MDLLQEVIHRMKSFSTDKIFKNLLEKIETEWKKREITVNKN